MCANTIIIPTPINKGIPKSIGKPGGVGPGGGGGLLPSAKTIILLRTNVAVKIYLKFIIGLATDKLRL